MPASEAQRQLYRAAIDFGAKEGWTVVQNIEWAVTHGRRPVQEVLQEVAHSCPHLFYPRKNRERKNQKAKRAAQSRAGEYDE